MVGKWGSREWALFLGFSPGRGVDDGKFYISDECLLDFYSHNRPHTLPPQSLYLAHLAPYLTSTQAQLESELQVVQAENEQLAKGIEGQRDEVERLVSGLEAVIADLEGANGVMEGVVEGAELRREVMEVETEVGGRGRGRGSRL